MNMVTKKLTLCLIHQHPKVLLGMKKRGFGEGKWNGFGGKVTKGESIENAARREVQEECGVFVQSLDKRGVVQFSSVETPEEVLEVHIFKAEHFTGEPTETEEMRPKWFSVDSIPFDAMWPDDVYWMPLLFAGKKFKGKFYFGKNDAIIDSSLNEVNDLLLHKYE